MLGPLLRLLISVRSVNKRGHHGQFLNLVGQFLNKSHLKPLSQMNRNLVGRIYGRSSIKIAHFDRKHLHNVRFYRKFPQNRMKGERHRFSLLRRVWRYQKGNQNPYIEDTVTTQWPKEKVQTTIYKTYT
jgi:hypothetical protein